jgi:acyl-CoA synthetase (AMP-forming)/AMP-acid ligase II
MQGYGQSESAPEVTSLLKISHQVLGKSLEEQETLASYGQPSLGVHVRVVDDKNNDAGPFTIGEIILQSRAMMVEYWHKPDATRDVLIVLKKGGQPTEEEMIDFCKQHLARYKAPKSVEFLESLPKNPQGKILKRELRKKYWRGSERKN